ncbi:cold shock domain-containing protein [Rurimicrobium arvi]|uniref:Cold shock domain-containing protein n=1 Tax=Rurimicrobium arvi TaxID=2049916 RepID=A0ABP8ME48_9BACT
MSQSFSKKEIAQKKAKQKKEKVEKMRERKAGKEKGKSLDDMLAYVDENGNLSSVPPDMSNKKEILAEDIILGAAPVEEENPERKGTVSFFNDAKGYGFITDDKTRENIFVHANQLAQPITEKDRVLFNKEKSARGMIAVNVRKYK